MRTYFPDSTVARALRDYMNSEDLAETVAKRNGVSASNLYTWAKRIGVQRRKEHRNWGLIKHDLGIS